MKNLIRSIALSVFLAASVTYGAVPSLNVIVSDSSGKAFFKGRTDAKGVFATAQLKPGSYVVQFSSPGAIKGNYAIVLSAGVKKVSAAGVAGEKFAKGGVALKVDVGNLLTISGQVAVEEAGASKDGKKMVWIPPQSGSHMPGRWVEADSAEAKAAKTAGTMSSQDLGRLQERTISPQGGN